MMLQVVWLYRRSFVSVMVLTFITLSIAVLFGQPRARVAIQSSIDVGAFVVRDKDSEKREPIEPPEQVAKMISLAIAPASLGQMALRGATPSVLSSLKNLSAESIGLVVSMTSTVDLDNEKEAKEFQTIIANDIIKRHNSRSQLLRERSIERLAAATGVSDLLEREIGKEVNEMTLLSSVSDNLRSEMESQRNNLVTLYKNSSSAEQASERSALEAQIRESQEQLSSKARTMESLAGERSWLAGVLLGNRLKREENAKTVMDVQLELKLSSDTHFLSLPSSTPAPPNFRWGSLLFVSLIISVLAAFGTIVLLHNNFGRKPAG